MEEVKPNYNYRKEIHFLGDSLEELSNFPQLIKNKIGFALHLAQIGKKSILAKPFTGHGVGVLEVVADFDTNTYRALYTIRFESRVYVLHVFQKKSTLGIATQKKDVDLIKRRLKEAEEDYKKWSKENERKNKNN